MEKQHLEEHAEPAPPYQERDDNPIRAEKSIQKSSSRQCPAQDRVSEIRQQRVKLLIDGHIQPLLENGLLHGQLSQTIIIVPSDTTTTSVVLTTSHLVHKPRSASTHITQLQGPNSTEAFWTQQRVIEDLERASRDALQSMTGALLPITALPPRPAGLSSPVTGQKSWLKRTFGLPGADHDPTGSTGQWRLGWRPEDETSREKPLAPDEFALSVKAKEVAFRTETEMGLLTTSTTKCIVIEVECGS